MDLSGTRLGKYRVEQKVAVGGMAEIYTALAPDDAKVAVKVILPHYASEEKFVQMFLDEARIVIHLKHPNIVQMLDFGRIGETYFFSMEWIDGKPLSAVIRRQLELDIHFPVEVALLLLIDVCDGLHYAHEKRDRFDRHIQIVHRDISPPNILITGDGIAKIADFGIADAKDKVIQTRPGIIRGKFSYMSPEQSAGKQVDARSDIFSAGIVLYEILSGKRLFLRETDIDTIKAVRKAQVPPLTEMRADISDDLDNLMQRALARDPKDRFSNAKEMSVELQTILQRDYGEIDRIRVREFLKALFPEQSFSGVHERADELRRRWKSIVEKPRARPDPLLPWFKRTLEKKFYVAAILALATVLFAELLRRL